MDPFLEATLILLRQSLLAMGVTPPAELAQAVEQPPDAALGDYAYPCFPLAKVLRKAPAAIAEELAQRMRAELASQPLMM